MANNTPNLGDPTRVRYFVRNNDKGQPIEAPQRVNGVKDYTSQDAEITTLIKTLNASKSDPAAVQAAIAAFNSSKSRAADARAAKLISDGYVLAPQPAPKAPSGRKPGRPSTQQS